jgi:hypothetical protein
VAVSPITQVATGPHFFIILAVANAETVREIAARLLYINPIWLGDTCCAFRSAEKKAWNVLSPTWNKNDTRQTVATPDHRDVPSGQEMRSVFKDGDGNGNGEDARSCLEEVVDSSLFLLELIHEDDSFSGFCCIQSVPTTIAANSDATLDTAITNDKDDVDVRKMPPKSGPTRKADVEAASLHAKCLDSRWGGDRSAKYAFETGDAPAKHPVRTREARNQARLFWFVWTKYAWVASPMAVPSSVRVRMGGRPYWSDKGGHRNKPTNIPNGYAEVREPKDAPTGSWKCCPRDGVSGPAMVNPNKFRKADKSKAVIDQSIDVNDDNDNDEPNLLVILVDVMVLEDSWEWRWSSVFLWVRKFILVLWIVFFVIVVVVVVVEEWWWFLLLVYLGKLQDTPKMGNDQRIDRHRIKLKYRGDEIMDCRLDSNIEDGCCRGR